MNKTSANAPSVRRVFDKGPRSVVDLVDDLLRCCVDGPLILEWRDDVCHATFPTNPVRSEEEIPLPKSVFRAILARIAALCNEHQANSVTPYGGNGELSVESSQTVIKGTARLPSGTIATLTLGERISKRSIQAAFANTTSETRLVLTPIDG